MRPVALAAMFGLWASAPAVAQEMPHIWPVAGVYGLDHTACNDDHSSAQMTAEIAPSLCPALEANKRIIMERFVQLMLAKFPGAEAEFAAHMPASATPHARLNSTLVASLRISRAIGWIVRKPGGDDGIQPIALTLDIVNAATGEVVFSRHRTDLGGGTFPDASAAKDMDAQFPAHLDAALAALVSDAAAAWHPSIQRGKIVGEISLEDGKAWVIDKGRQAGLRAGDSIGADGKILHAGASYSIVRPTISTYHEGDLLARTLVAPAEVLARPSVLVSVGQVPPGYAAAFLAGVFEDALGAGGGFAPMPITPAFTALRTKALSDALAVDMDSRALPDFVASVDIAVLPAGHFPSKVPGVSTARFEAHVFVSLVDRTGRIVASFHGSNRIEDQIAGGMGFSDSQRQDTVLKNALFDAAQQMAAWHPKSGILPVSARGASIFVADPTNALPMHTQVPVLRDHGHVGGIHENVLVPVAQIEAQEAADGGVIASYKGGLLRYAPHSGDVVVIDAEGAALAGRGGLAQCLASNGTPIVEDRGQVPVMVWSAAAEGILATHAKWPVRSAMLARRLAPLKESFVGWDRFAPANAPSTDRCFIPVVQIAPDAAGYGFGIGYKLIHGIVTPTVSGLHIEMKPSALPMGTSQAAAQAQLQVDLASAALPLAAKAAEGLVLAATTSH